MINCLIVFLKSLFLYPTKLYKKDLFFICLLFWHHINFIKKYNLKIINVKVQFVYRKFDYLFNLTVNCKKILNLKTVYTYIL